MEFYIFCDLVLLLIFYWVDKVLYSSGASWEYKVEDLRFKVLSLSFIIASILSGIYKKFSAYFSISLGSGDLVISPDVETAIGEVVKELQN